MKGRRAGRVALGVLLIAAVFFGGWAAGKAVLSEPDADDPIAAAAVTADVVQADVGRSLSFGVTVRQPFETVAANALAGVVTASADQVEADVGDQVYAVAGIPVRLVQGPIPFYRDLARGTEGADVSQLQQALVDLGYLSGPVDGRFGAATEGAVRAWQRDAGVQRTGVIRLGELIAVPTLPATVRVGEAITVGAVLAGGEAGLGVRTGEVRFEMVLAQDQAALVPADAAITVEFEGTSWSAVIAGQRTNEMSQTILELTAPEGGSVCGSDCARLPAQEETNLTAAVEVVPSVSGPAVPAAAVRTDTSGVTYVLLADDVRADVTVLGSSGGVAVVDGLTEGQQVQISSPGDAETS